MADERETRTCSECGQEDDHPHHTMYAVVSFTDPNTGEQVSLDRSLSRHLDCCNCDHCGIVLAAAGDKRGPELIDYLTTDQPELRTSLTNAGYEVGNG